MAARLDDLVEGGQDHDGDLVIAIAQIDAEAAAKSNQCMFFLPPFFCLPPILLCNLCCGCYFCSLSELRGTKAWITPKFLKIDKNWAFSKSSARIPLEKIQNVDLRSGWVRFQRVLSASAPQPAFADASTGSLASQMCSCRPPAALTPMRVPKARSLV
jgi:hypothetical protein